MNTHQKQGLDAKAASNSGRIVSQLPVHATSQKTGIGAVFAWFGLGVASAPRFCSPCFKEDKYSYATMVVEFNSQYLIEPIHGSSSLLIKLPYLHYLV
jgi:hypothetical protein